MKYLVVVLTLLSFSSALFAKEIRRAKIEDPTKYSVRMNGAVNWRGEDRNSIATIKSNFVISGTMKMKWQAKGGYAKTFEIDQMQVNYSHLAQIYKKKPDKNCTELLKFEVKAAGSMPITKGSLRIRYEEKVPAGHPLKQSMLDFMFDPGLVPGKMKILDHCKYTTREEGLVIAYVGVIDTSKIARDQTSFSGSRSFGIPDSTNIEGLSRVMPFIFSDKVLSGGPSSLPKEIESILSSAGDNLLVFKGFSTGGKAGMPPGNDAQLTWKIKIGPSVEIWRDDKDITDQVQDAMVGERINLKAVVEPYGDSSKGVWEIPESVISGFVADAISGKVILLEEEQKRNPVIEFFFTDGEFSKGKPFEITYTTDDKKLQGKTTFKVFKPEAIIKGKVPSKEITVGPFENTSCRVYLGKLEIINPPKGKPGMLISHEIKMPTQFSNQPHLLWYVQRVKEEVLEYHTADYFQRVNKEWCLDTHYPYAKMKPVPYKVEMNDSPCADLGLATKEVHLRDQYETYLMFIPSGSPEDKNCVWIPLKVVEWGWDAAVKRTVDWDENPPCDDKTFKFLYGHYTKPTENDCKKHPEWSCNVETNKREEINEDAWEKLKVEIRNIKSKQK